MNERLIMASAGLANLGPPWDEFVAAFTEYKHECLDQMMKATPDKVHQLQGRAHSATELLQMFHECRATARSLTERKNARSS